MSKRKLESHKCDICRKEGCICSSKRRCTTVKIMRTPNVENLQDLIDLAKLPNVLFSNINIFMLRNIAPYIEELENMIGLKELKNSIFEQLLYYIQSMHTINKNDFLHTCITGAPGCGKTTIAKIISKIYQYSGILSSGIFKVATRADLIGGYLGQTTLKTQKLLESCIGGVLFIDEIYSIGNNKKDGDSYSKECIDCINLFLSEHKNDFCLIIAGYEDEIKNRFFASNEGLERRFQWYHNIKEYNSQELACMTLKMVNEINWKTTVSIPSLEKLIQPNMKTVFKNSGGSIENWISRTKLAHSKRVFSLDYKDKYILSLTDFKNALNILVKTAKPLKEEVHLDMYL